MNNWIKVSDRLPKIYNQELGYSKEVLCYSAKLLGKYFISRYDHYDEMWSYEKGHDAEYNQITHWQSLPEEPE